MKRLFLFLSIVFFSHVCSAQNNVVIYWDASLSMQNRELQKEINFLESYFLERSNYKVILIAFSNEILLNKGFSINNNDWMELKDEIMSLPNDGATYFNNIKLDNSVDAYLIFSDCKNIIGKINIETNKPVTVVSSNSDCKPYFLNTYGQLVNQVVLEAEDIEASNLNTNTIVRRNSNNSKNTISGKITDKFGGLSEVNIINKTSGKGTKSDSNGNYSLTAKPNDIIVFSYIGKQSKEIKLDQDNLVNIFMTSKNEQLNELVITAESGEEELVLAGDRKIEKRKLGYAVATVGGDDLNTSYNNFDGAITGKVAGVQRGNIVDDEGGNFGQFLIRGFSSIERTNHPLIVVDGVPLPRSKKFDKQDYSFINPKNVKEVNVLKGLAATNRYGSEGSSGVILITTKTGSGKALEKKNKVALGTTASYSDNASLIAALPDSKYIKALKNSASIDDAFNNYLELRSEYFNKAEFYIDVYDYFMVWNNPFISKRILSNIYEIFPENTSVLRGLAFKQVQNKMYEEALFTFEKVLKLEPNQSQSYRDLALAYSLNEDYQKALNLYHRIDKRLRIGNTNFAGVNKTISNEFKNLISQHKSRLNINGINQKYLSPLKQKKRIVFEWNNPYAEFNLQIVNPQKRFFTWSHTKAKEPQRIADEIQQGYGLEEYFITDADVGDWLFNIEYFGSSNEHKVPTYLMITTYTNYGSPNQSVERKVIRLFNKKELQTVAKISI